MLRLAHRSFILVSIFGWAFFLFLFPSFSLAQALKGKGKFGKRKEIALAKGKMETIMTGMRFQVLTFLSFTPTIVSCASAIFPFGAMRIEKAKKTIGKEGVKEEKESGMLRFISLAFSLHYTSLSLTFFSLFVFILSHFLLFLFPLRPKGRR